ncbi:MAG: hypothetical protein MJY62_02160 [Bacteroidales bacterium]|nr:hypothetical protein [Bacteroidales bacterium]
MKFNRLFSLAVAAALTLTLTLPVSCKKEDPIHGGEQTGEVVLSNQSEVDAFKAVKSLTSLTIQGTDITNIDNISVTTVGTLIIKGTSVEVIDNSSFTTLNKYLEISGNPSLRNISNFGTKFSTADILIQNNAVLDTIKGFLNLKKMTGSFTIKDNPALGEDDANKGKEWGFNVLKELVDNQIMTNSQITLSNNHPKAVTDPALIGSGSSGMPSYTIRNSSDLKQITRSECQNLTVLGPDVDDVVWNDIKSTGLQVVHGDLVCEGCNFNMCANFFEKNGVGVKVEGSIIMKNFVAWQEDCHDNKRFLNPDNIPTHVGGQIYLEKMYLHGWAGAGWNEVTEVDGSVTLRECNMNAGVFGTKMAKIHGNLIIDNLKYGCTTSAQGPWNMNQANFQEIDSSLVIINNGWFSNLDGFQNVTKIGDSLIIKNNFADAKAAGNVSGWAFGKGNKSFDLVQQWIFDGVVDPAKVVCIDEEGKPVSFRSYKPVDVTITCQNDIDALAVVEGGLVAKSLTVSGATVTDEVFANIKTKISEVQGALVIDGCKITTLANFFLKADGSGTGVRCGGDITIKNIDSSLNQAGNFLNSDNFPKEPKGNVTLENVSLHGWASAGFNVVTSLPANLTIKDCKMGGTAAFIALKSVEGNLTLDGIKVNYKDTRVWNPDQWTITSVGGKLTIQNTQYTDFKGLLNLKKIGSLYVKDNPIAKATFSTVQGWIDAGVIAKANAECYDSDGNKVIFADKATNYPDYATVVKGHDAIVEFAKTERQDYRYLVIDGNDEAVTDAEMANLKASVKDVTERLIFKNIKSWTMVEQVITKGDFVVTPKGSLEILDCPDLNNVGGLKALVKVNGDLIIKNTPNVALNWSGDNCLNNITEITGDFILDNASQKNITGTTCLASLTKVGGNMILTNLNTNFWDLNGMPLTEIGGNFIYTDNKLVNSFKGFLGLKKIGGRLEVSGTAISDFSPVQGWINDGVVEIRDVECYNSKGQRVNFSGKPDVYPEGSVIITNQADIDKIVLPDGNLLAVENLVLRGADVTNEVLANVQTKIKSVVNLYCDGCSFAACANIFGSVAVTGSISFKNMCNGTSQYLNTAKIPTTIGGDLTIENVRIHGWKGLGGIDTIEEIKGNLTIATEVITASVAFISLKKVGGNLVVDGARLGFNGGRLWNLDQWVLENIGGKLSIMNTSFNSFNGLKGLKSIGSVYLKGNEISDFTQVQAWITAGVVAKSKVECYDTKGNLVAFE